MRAPQQGQEMLLRLIFGWPPEDDPAWHTQDVVNQSHLSEVYARYRINGQGGAAYDRR